MLLLDKTLKSQIGKKNKKKKTLQENKTTNKKDNKNLQWKIKNISSQDTLE